MSKDTEEVGHLVPPALDFLEMRPDLFGGFRSRYIADKRHERCPLVLWALDCPMSLEVRGPADHPSGGAPSPSRIRPRFRSGGTKMTILAGAERGVQGVSGPVVRFE